MATGAPLSALLPVTARNQHDFAAADGHRRRTWGELAQRSDRTANAIRALGLGEGDRFAVLMRNRVEWLEVVVGNLLAGTEYVPVNWHLAAPEIAYLLEDSGARFLLHDSTTRGLCESAVALCPGVRLLDVDREWEAAVGAAPARLGTSGRAGAVLIYTGGTTGRPKAVIRDEVRRVPLDELPDFHRRAATEVWHFPAGPAVHLTVCPLYHGAPPGLMLYSLLLGQSVVVHDAFDAERTLATIERERVTVLPLVPIQILRLLRLAPEVRSRYDLSSLEYVVHGAAPCPRWAKEALIDWLGPIAWEYYGAVEGTGPFLCDSRTWLERPGTVGKPPPSFEVWAEDGQGKRLGPGQVGELRFRNSAGSPAYYHDEAKTSAAVRPDGTYSIGDFGWFDEDGYLYIADRRADLILSGGVNIYPAEIEAALSAHPGVRDVAAVGLPDDEWGERIHAVIEVEAGTVLTPGDLGEHCRRLIAGFKCPRSYEFVDHLPRDESGKLRRNRVRELSRAAQRGAGH
jgi:long-chain acyl-CoA synthetase